MMAKCKHRWHPQGDRRDVIIDGKTIEMRYRQCLQCWAWLPLGPSNDTPEVLVEIHAARIAAKIADAGFGLSRIANRAEAAGWEANRLGNGEPRDRRRRAGYWARRIWLHDLEHATYTGGSP